MVVGFEPLSPGEDEGFGEVFEEVSEAEGSGGGV